MRHLDQLAKLDRAYAVFHAVVGVLCAVGMIGLAAIGYRFGDPVMGGVMLGTTALLVVLVGAIVALLLATGRRVVQGRWRVVQTVVAALSLTNNPPLGTLYGAYALWVCWVHPPTRARFDDPDAAAAPDPPAESNRFYRWTMGVMLAFGVLFTLLTVGTFVGVGVLLHHGGQEPEVHVTDAQIEITGMYGETLDRADLTAVELHDELPTITLRTNGYAMGGTLKGWFDTVEYDRVKLFVHTDVPPYVYLIADERVVIVGHADPDATRALHEALSGPHP